MKAVFSITHVGAAGRVMVTRHLNGEVRYLRNLSKPRYGPQEPFLYRPADGEAVAKAAANAGYLHMTDESAWIERECDKLPSKKPMSMFPPGRHHTGWPGSKSAIEVNNDEAALYAPLRFVEPAPRYVEHG